MSTDQAENNGPFALKIMWTMTALTWSFVALRLWTRIVVVRGFGVDDYVYCLSAVLTIPPLIANSHEKHDANYAVKQILLLCYNIFLQVSLRYGFGQNVLTLDVDDIAMAIKIEMIGQTFAIIGMAVAKASMGLFLLRLVVMQWHKIAVWLMTVALLCVSVLTAAVFWAQCLPPKGIWDQRERPKSKCNIEITPFAVTLGVSCILADFFFAVFPLTFIWQLNMKRREKITIGGSMSLGLVACAAGIVRTHEVATGFMQNYTQDTVPLIIWSSVEMAVTMICIGIPVTMPLWRRLVDKVLSSTDDNLAPYERHEDDGNSESLQLDSILPRNGKPAAHILARPIAGPNLAPEKKSVKAMANNSEEMLQNEGRSTLTSRM